MQVRAITVSVLAVICCGENSQERSDEDARLRMGIARVPSSGGAANKNGGDQTHAAPWPNIRCRLYPFRFREPLSGKWRKARYRAELHEDSACSGLKALGWSVQEPSKQ